MIKNIEKGARHPHVGDLLSEDTLHPHSLHLHIPEVGHNRHPVVIHGRANEAELLQQSGIGQGWAIVPNGGF